MNTAQLAFKSEISEKLKRHLEQNPEWEGQLFDSHSQLSNGLNTNYSVDGIGVEIAQDQLEVVVELSNEYRDCSDEESEELSPGSDTVRLQVGSISQVQDKLEKGEALALYYQSNLWATVQVW